MDQPQDQMREQIGIRHLPEAIRTAGWNVTAAYKGHMRDPNDSLALHKVIRS